MRIGIGYDVHRLVEGRKLILGGVEIPFEKGLLGHSDADVLLHAITDALLGALALGDIGKHFPDTDGKLLHIDSRILLRKAYSLVKEKGYKLQNVDTVICAQKPKLQEYLIKMRTNIASDLEAEIEQISVKATTEERLGISGSEAGMTAYATVLLIKI
ncbi:MAG: 2-C-methyl-D-erythritol 2,4-cyclodiphosphate synthase [Candidatus Cloacimonadales bacterium]|jgi:2-C-methyl-D-erythritol 2,4-cyclodiphosphate synthase|nr:2-C-methyl-D-erythritol 2,4-cyclodiphosphate synthase [Candidatus Cloacimonadota bacterium]MDD2650157.1 2-C-methyl-D-erythritol 2,4-cyclodiphosphate synthase [Candidatus Cloacimonadota bacterium]MDD3501215.1 2-C-methyl-D-erythritol 2,4-cyclodiphosphate synthase [Candidatus Cloacimonadota bacterium]MDX9978253.1 2-C-methyl-D-erythritol 2,4-cyclodiphosphate synthase [Candidatus Cloacimonadales bacterium]